MDNTSVKTFKKKYSLEIFLLAVAFLANRLLAGYDFFLGSNWLLFVNSILVYLIIVSKRSSTSLLKSSDSSGTILLLALIIAYFNAFINSNGFSFIWAIYYIVCAFFMYLIGEDIGKHIQSGRQFVYFMLTCAISMALPHIIITLLDIRTYGLINPLRQLQLLDDTVQMDTTARTIELSLCLCGIAFLFQPTTEMSERRMKWLFIILSVVSLICTAHYLSRTGYLLFALTFMLGFLYYRLKPSGSTFVTIILVLVGAYIVWSLLQGSEILSLYEGREEDEGSSLMAGGGRTTRWVKGLNGLIAYPFGERNSRYYCHNLWLDYGRCYGIIPFVLLVVFSLKNIRYSIRFVRKHTIDNDLRFCVLLFTIVFFLSCFTECIHEGMPAYLFMYCMYCGVVSTLYKRRNVFSISKE